MLTSQFEIAKTLDQTYLQALSPYPLLNIQKKDWGQGERLLWWSWCARSEYHLLGDTQNVLPDFPDPFVLQIKSQATGGGATNPFVSKTQRIMVPREKIKLTEQLK